MIMRSSTFITCLFLLLPALLLLDHSLIPGSDAQRQAVRADAFYRRRQDLEASSTRRREVAAATPANGGGGFSLERLGWAAAGLALVGSALTVFAATDARGRLEEQLQRQLEQLEQLAKSASVAGTEAGPGKEPPSPRERRQLLQEEEGGGGLLQDYLSRSTESCWQLAICDAHARYDDYGLVALPITIFYSG